MKINLRSLIANYSYYTLPVAMLVVIFVLFTKFDLPKLKEINEVRQQLSSIKQRWENLSTKSQLLANMNKEEVTGQLERTRLVLPDGKDAPSILRTLETAASSSGVFVENLDLAPGKLATGGSSVTEKNEIPIRVTISGTLSQITNYLSSISRVGRAMEPNSLEATFPETTDSAKLNLELVAYFLFPNEKPKKVEDSLPVFNNEQEATLKEVYQREILSPVLLLPQGEKTDLFK